MFGPPFPTLKIAVPGRRMVTAGSFYTGSGPTAPHPPITLFVDDGFSRAHKIQYGLEGNMTFDPNIGLNTRFRKGRSGNAGGRPKSRLLSEALRNRLGQVKGGRQRKHMVDEFRELLVRCGEDVCGFVL